MLLTELNGYIAVLDKQREHKGQTEVAGLVAKKITAETGIPSTSRPPPNAPKWAVNINWESTRYVYILFFIHKIIISFVVAEFSTENQENEPEQIILIFVIIVYYMPPFINFLLIISYHNQIQLIITS